MQGVISINLGFLLVASLVIMVVVSNPAFNSKL
jgi:hypothetical protein